MSTWPAEAIEIRNEQPATGVEHGRSSHPGEDLEGRPVVENEVGNRCAHALRANVAFEVGPVPKRSQARCELHHVPSAGHVMARWVRGTLTIENPQGPPTHTATKVSKTLDAFPKSSSVVLMTSRELLKLIRKHGCTVDAKGGKGSHVKVTCEGGCTTYIPNHKGEDIKEGTLKAIEKQR